MVRYEVEGERLPRYAQVQHFEGNKAKCIRFTGGEEVSEFIDREKLVKIGNNI